MAGVAAGYNHTVVCTDDGKMFTFGYGDDGPLGHGELHGVAKPILVYEYSSTLLLRFHLAHPCT